MIKYTISTLLLAVVALSCQSGYSCDLCVYCPLGTGGTRHIKLPAFLVLDADNEPAFIEVRRKDMSEDYLFRSEDVFFRAYGAVDIQMKPEWVGVQFQLFSDTLSETPDTVFVIDVEWEDDYFEIHL